MLLNINVKCNRITGFPPARMRVNLRALSVVFVAIYYHNVGSATVPTLNGGHGGPPYDNLLLS
jgi:hypothetical protein